MKKISRAFMQICIICLSTGLITTNIAANNFSLGTGGKGGTYFPVGQAIAKATSGSQAPNQCDSNYIGNCGVKNLDVTALVTNASAQNIAEVNAGTMQFGISDAATLYFAFNGLKKFKGNKLQNLRVVANLFPEDLHLVLRKDIELNGLDDLAGKKVGIAQAGSGTQHAVLTMLSAFNVTRDNIEEFETSQTESADLLSKGKLDAYFYAAGTPVSTLVKLGEEQRIKLYSFTEEEVKKVNKAVPYYIPSTIKSGTYPNINYDTHTLAVSAILVTHDNQPSTIMYDFVKSLWNDYAQYIYASSHPKTQDITLDSALNGLDSIGVPLHSGAEKFYKRMCQFTVPRSPEKYKRYPIECSI